MKLKMTALLLTTVFFQQVNASCIESYLNKKDIEYAKGEYALEKGGLASVGLGAAGIFAGSVIAAPVAGAIAVASLVYYDSKTSSENQYNKIANAIYFSKSYKESENYHNKYIEHEASFLSERLFREVSSNELKSAINDIDEENGFCPNGMPVNKKEFRNLLEEKLNQNNEQQSSN